MGASLGLSRKRSLQKLFLNFKRQDWQQVAFEQQESKQRYGDYITLRNKTTKQQIDQYQLTFYSDRQQRIYEQCFLQRLRQQCLVNSFHYQIIRSPGFCSNVRGAVVYIQHIPIRLSDVTDIPFDQSLYIIRSAMLGFEKLYNQSGYFQVMEEHIGIDRQGQIKVWLNTDLSKNYPYSFNEQSQHSRDYQRIMVGQILGIIQKNTNFQGNTQRTNNLPVSQFMLKKNIRHPSFVQIQQVLRQYNSFANIEVPKRCSSVVEIFQQQFGQQFNVTSASDFLDHIDVGDNQAFHQNQNVEVNQTIKLKSSRAAQIQEKLSGHRSSSVMQSRAKQNGQSISMPYRQYQPISTYKPNEKNKRVSAAEQSNRVSRTNQKNARMSRQSNKIIKYKNSRPHSRNSSGHNQDKISVSNSIKLKPYQNTRNYRGSGLYAERPSTNSNMYMQIGDDLQRLYGDNSNQQQQPAINLDFNDSSLKGSNVSHESKQSNMSEKVSRKQNSHRSNGGAKITFNYVNRQDMVKQTQQIDYNNVKTYKPQSQYIPSNDNRNFKKRSKEEKNTKQNNKNGNAVRTSISRKSSTQSRQIVNQHEKKQNKISIRHSRSHQNSQDQAYYNNRYQNQINYIDQQKIDRQFKRDLQMQLRKDQQIYNQSQSGNIHKKSQLKSYLYNDQIFECENQQQIDSDILKDLVKQYPEASQRKIVY